MFDRALNMPPVSFEQAAVKPPNFIHFICIINLYLNAEFYLYNKSKF